MCVYKLIVTSKTPRLSSSFWKSLRFDPLCCCLLVTREVSAKSLDVREKDKRLGHMGRFLDLYALKLRHTIHIFKPNWSLAHELQFFKADELQFLLFVFLQFFLSLSSEHMRKPHIITFIFNVTSTRKKYWKKKTNKSSTWLLIPIRSLLFKGKD